MPKNVIRWLILALLLLLPAAVYGQDDISDDEVNQVAKDLYCPVCESTPLDVCPTQACADWRELIRTKLAAGETRQDVLDYFARQYGDGVLANPPRRGVSLIVLWVLPVLLVLLGGFLFFPPRPGGGPAPRAAVSSPPPYRRPAPTRRPAAKPDEPMDEYIARVERELKQ